MSKLSLLLVTYVGLHSLASPVLPHSSFYMPVILRDSLLWYGAVCSSIGPYVRSIVYNPCGQDKERTIWPRMLKLSVYTLYGQRKKPNYFHWASTKNSGTWILVGRI